MYALLLQVLFVNTNDKDITCDYTYMLYYYNIYIHNLLKCILLTLEIQEK